MSEKHYREAEVRYNGVFAGRLSETENGYQFLYDKNYLDKGQPLSVSLPLRREAYQSKKLFSFFEGLLPEGWYLDIVSSSEKVDSHDAFGLLLATSSSTIGAVTVHKPSHGS